MKLESLETKKSSAAEKKQLENEHVGLNLRIEILEKLIKSEDQNAKEHPDGVFGEIAIMPMEGFRPVDNQEYISSLLSKQLNSMREYSEVLSIRIMMSR